MKKGLVDFDEIEGLTAIEVAKKFIGVKEIPGVNHNGKIVDMLRLDDISQATDETPWCSAFVNYVCWLQGLERSKSLSARSWLKIGREIDIESAAPGNVIVVLKRGVGNQPGKEVLQAPGHVGFFNGLTDLRKRISVLGGNQSDSVKISSFPLDLLLSCRELSYV
jgi:uncharacterized protein (TIGR02594 family)